MFRKLAYFEEGSMECLRPSFPGITFPMENDASLIVGHLLRRRLDEREGAQLSRKY
jgi:hypothetical protein